MTEPFTHKACIFTEYLRFRCELRGFELQRIEQIWRYSAERYFDTETQRHIVVGEHGKQLVMIPYDENDSELIPVTIHATTRQQLRFRLNTGRLTYE